jgi:hypothetical protein
MNIFKICTTAYSEEDFFIMTDLVSSQVYKTLTTAKNERRYEFDNDELVAILKDKYPHHIIEHYTEIERITI